METLLVEKEETGLRLDLFLSKRLPEYSRSYMQSLIEEELVLVNGQTAKKRRKMEEGDEIEVEFALTKEIDLLPEAIPLDILYEDSYLLAINKPVGLVVHPAVGNWTGTFVNALLYHCQHLPIGDSLRPGIVHRLDRETSGVLLAAKEERTQRLLVHAFAQREIHKEYRAICIGNPGMRTINAPIGRHPTKRKEMAVLQTGGKEAETRVETLSTGEGLSYLRLIPKTGRTHQLRVHLKSIQSPILGDAVYGSPSLNQKFKTSRQLLHAYSLRFQHPITQEEIEVKAPLPQDMEKFVKLLQKNAK